MVDWNEFKSGKVAVWCDTKEKAKEFVNECFKRNIKWYNEKSEYKINWDDCKEDTCYSFDKASRCLQYGTEYFFTRWDYKIVKWDTQNTNNENTFSDIINKLDKEFVDSFKTDNKTVRDCKTCMHNRVCSHKDKNEEYKQQMKDLIEKWGEDNGFGFTEDCPEWHEQPVSIKFDNGSEIKTILHDDNTRDKRAELPIHYFDYEKCPEDIFESPYIKAKLNDDKYKYSIEILRSLVKSINEANKLRN